MPRPGVPTTRSDCHVADLHLQWPDLGLQNSTTARVRGGRTAGQENQSGEHRQMQSTKANRVEDLVGGGDKCVQQQGRSRRHLARRALFLETLEPRNLLATGAALPLEELVGTESGVQADLPSVLLPVSRNAFGETDRPSTESPTSAPERREIVFVDAATPDAGRLLRSCPPRPSPIGSWRSHFSTRHRMGLRSSISSLPQSRAGTRFT